MVLRPISFVALCTLFATASCTKKETPAVDPSVTAPGASVSVTTAPSTEPAATAAPSVSQPGDTFAPLEGLSSWTDPAIVKHLEDSCTFDPSKLPEDQKHALFGDATGNANDFSCEGNAFDQSCVYDPCFEADDAKTCKGNCLATCDTCASACTTSCTSCKAQCKDDACKKACAPACGKCKQDCLTAQDRCRSGTCGQLYTACRKKITADWKAKGCEARCKTFEPCRDTCYERTAEPGFDASACIGVCAKKVKPGCDLSLCGSMGGE